MGKMVRVGERYKKPAPDTLDLTERAVLAIHGLAGVLDPKANYEHWFSVIYHERLPFMIHDSRSFSACGPKLLESFPMMRIMSGDEKAIPLAKKLVNYVTKARFWGSEYGWPKTVVRKPSHMVQAYKIVGSDRAHFEGHFHGHTVMLFALGRQSCVEEQNGSKTFPSYPKLGESFEGRVYC